MAEEESGTGKKRDTGKLLAFGFVGLNLITLGLGTYLVYAATLGYTPAKLSEQEAAAEMEEFRKSLQGKPVIYKMETFNTNLAGVPRRLIRMEVNLEMLDEEGFEEVIGLGAEARDSIVRIINSKSYHQVETVQGKLHLKNQIITQLNSFLRRGVVNNVYFSDFVVQ